MCKHLGIGTKHGTELEPVPKWFHPTGTDLNIYIYYTYSIGSKKGYAPLD